MEGMWVKEQQNQLDLEYSVEVRWLNPKMSIMKNKTQFVSINDMRGDLKFRLTCSIFRSVVGVNVAVVLVGTPLCIPSKDTSCN